MAVLVVRAGRERFNIEPIVIILGGQLAAFRCLSSGAGFGSGEGGFAPWLSSLPRTELASRHLRAGDSATIATAAPGVRRSIIKPPPPGNRKRVDRRARIADEIGSTTSPRRPTQVESLKDESTSRELLVDDEPLR